MMLGFPPVIRLRGASSVFGGFAGFMVGAPPGGMFDFDELEEKIEKEESEVVPSGFSGSNLNLRTSR